MRALPRRLQIRIFWKIAPSLIGESRAELASLARTLGLIPGRKPRAGAAAGGSGFTGSVSSTCYGAIGLVATPCFVLFELLAPVVEAVGVASLFVGLALGAINWPFAALFFLVAYGLGILFSLLIVLLDEVSFTRTCSIRDRFILLSWVLLENVGYRQMRRVAPEGIVELPARAPGMGKDG